MIMYSLLQYYTVEWLVCMINHGMMFYKMVTVDEIKLMKLNFLNVLNLEWNVWGGEGTWMLLNLE